MDKSTKWFLGWMGFIFLAIFCIVVNPIEWPTRRVSGVVMEYRHTFWPWHQTRINFLSLSESSSFVLVEGIYFPTIGNIYEITYQQKAWHFRPTVIEIRDLGEFQESGGTQ